MPASVVKTKADEKKWDKAKELAAEQGHREEYDYIMGIYKKMKPDYFKGKKSSIGLKAKLIRLAYEKPQLRADLLPLLKRESRSSIKVSVNDRDFQELIERAAEGAQFLGFSFGSLNQLGFSAFLEVEIALANMAGQDTKTIFKKDVRAVQKALKTMFPRVRVADEKYESGFVKFDVGYA